MTQPKDTTDVKPSTPSRPLAKKRLKTPEAVRAAAAAACVGAACAGPQQTEPERPLAALRQPRPPPEECPPGTLDTKKELQIGKAGVSTPDGFIVPFETGTATLREGPAVFELNDSLGTLPRYGTTVVGRLFFAEGRIHGWFTEARTRDGRSFPVCLVLLDSHREAGWEPEGAGEEPGTVRAMPLGKVGWVKRFK
ncbi:hypothetical protein [Myxococcus sp. RHSTA-1-4]|uniref:hypothetical protein n=1 Tax=Myxococcus sp. RHSTA-1-4 TaxID=2874601 RepID=UPI001CBAEE4E|nr:hypothetical protein [Myxococcus sp. RHSTA-1-4]MBZ4422355.1 hypothetical protein [Myxococcus sp. RHSTA-1-4]